MQIEAVYRIEYQMGYKSMQRETVCQIDYAGTSRLKHKSDGLSVHADNNIIIWTNSIDKIKFSMADQNEKVLRLSISLQTE